MSKQQIKLGAMIHGVGHGWGEWRHPDALAALIGHVGLAAPTHGNTLRRLPGQMA